jgi:chitin disaccharide deacetylase
MKKFQCILLGILVLGSMNAQDEKAIYLLIRGDDIGSSHSSNEACIRSYKEGIMQSVEIMAPCAWYPEAVRMLKENPGLDVGIHLTITSEWNEYKWRPLTCCPSLVDSNGYFYPMIWQRDDFPKGTALHDANWKIEEIEQEFRAQIDRVKRDLPWVSHMGCHMGCTSCDPQIAELEKKLALEYGLDINPDDYGVEYTGLWSDKDSTAEMRIKSTLATLRKMKPGKYLFIDHPGMNTPEMKAIWHTGYYGVAADRDAVTQVYSSPEVKALVRALGIKLISYADLKKLKL